MVRRGRPTVEIKLSGEERKTLTRWAQRHSSAQALALRCKIVLACAEGGRTHVEIAASLGCNAVTVSKWRHRFAADRLDGLIDAPRDIAQKDIEGMEAELKKLKGEGEKVQQQLTPEQRALLIAAHKLVANKNFGWSRLFADLEQILPGGVSVSRISIQNVYQDGDQTKAELDFGVLSRDYQNVITMIDNMNSSRIFQADLRGQDRQKTELTTYTEYNLRLIYSPNYSTAPTEREVDVVQGGTQ